ncbi:hypothetical protein IJ707_02470 [bacterium]|nr:hypothetical protein [bacterium]
MKNFIIIAILILFFTPKSIAAISSYKTFTPTSPYYNYNNGYLPPPPPNIINHNNNKYWNRRNYYNSYNNPYYYPQKRTLFNTLGDFFSSGKMTGYTNSNFDDDIPYGYQEGFQDSNGRYYQHNYGLQNGATIKILD